MQEECERFHWWVLRADVEGQGARCRGVIELGLAREHFEYRDVEVELGAREAVARVDELHLVDDAFVALATGDAEAGAGRFEARFRGGDRVAGRLQAIERLLHFELNLQCRFFATRRGLARFGASAARFRAVGAAVEELPVEEQRDRAEVAAAAEVVVLVLDAAVDAERQRRLQVRARKLHAGFGSARGAIELVELGPIGERRGAQGGEILHARA